LKTFLGEESLRARFCLASVTSSNVSLGFLTVFGLGFLTVFTAASASTSSDLRFLPLTVDFDALCISTSSPGLSACYDGKHEVKNVVQDRNGGCHTSAASVASFTTSLYPFASSVPASKLRLCSTAWRIRPGVKVLPFDYKLSVAASCGP